MRAGPEEGHNRAYPGRFVRPRRLFRWANVTAPELSFISQKSISLVGTRDLDERAGIAGGNDREPCPVQTVHLADIHTKHKHRTHTIFTTQPYSCNRTLVCAAPVLPYRPLAAA